MDPDPKFLSEEEAARFWQRAAQLQAEAAQKAEALAEEPGSEDADGAPPEGYALTHVRSAALEAGISEEFMDAALADLRAERALPRKKRKWSLPRWILKNPSETITVRRVIEAPPAEVLSAARAGSALGISPSATARRRTRGAPRPSPATAQSWSSTPRSRRSWSKSYGSARRAWGLEGSLRS